jgi:cell wall assembly regulator SMI1
LEQRIGARAPHLLKKLPSGVSPLALEQAENALGLQLPALLRELYLIHNGIGMPTFTQHGEHRVAEPCDFLPIESLVEEWTMMKDLLEGGHLNNQVKRVRGPVRPVWWNTRWLPIAADCAGNYYCVDLDPDSGGVVAQVVAFWHDDAERTVKSSEVGSFLLEHVDELEWAARERADLATN